ncbi:MAG: M23 family metallopeptidase [Bacteroidales bacterium]|jgi:murein DD-endopeptidase MepM/ murein hydrolase activator NlpD|nr:M23 family metallopeptidase [Bacteroidales bacterium]MDD3160419.1 M23 family metallopeptidase [Bacteroidales bacterium]
MAKKHIHYFWNPETLSFERIYTSFRDRLFLGLKHLLVAGMGGLVVLALINLFFDSPRVKSLKEENDRLQTQYELLSHRVQHAYEILDDIQERDNNFYRALLHAEPISSSIRKGSFAGTERYDSLQDLSSARLVIGASQQVDVLRKQLYVQSQSFDELVGILKDNESFQKCVPAIQPLKNKDLKQTASGFGVRLDPIYGTPRFHSGMDFTAKRGTEVYATGDGVVAQATRDGAYGNCIIINHGFGYQTMYAHLDSYNVKNGAKVTRGQVIGFVGDTGKATGVHLHYEVHYKGRTVNPANYYYMDLTPEEYDIMVEMAANSGHVYD